VFTNLLSGTDTLSVSESIGVQANNQLLDAEILSPYLLAAYANATAPGADPLLQAIVADPRIGDAIGRLSAWDFSTPTGNPGRVRSVRQRDGHTRRARNQQQRRDVDLLALARPGRPARGRPDARHASGFPRVVHAAERSGHERVASVPRQLRHQRRQSALH
jgi:hypothetical protein